MQVVQQVRRLFRLRRLPADEPAGRHGDRERGEQGDRDVAGDRDPLRAAHLGREFGEDIQPRLSIVTAVELRRERRGRHRRLLGRDRQVQHVDQHEAEP